MKSPKNIKITTNNPFESLCGSSIGLRRG